MKEINQVFMSNKLNEKKSENPFLRELKEAILTTRDTLKSDITTKEDIKQCAEISNKQSEFVTSTSGVRNDFRTSFIQFSEVVTGGVL